MSCSKHVLFVHQMPQMFLTMVCATKSFFWTSLDQTLRKARSSRLQWETGFASLYLDSAWSARIPAQIPATQWFYVSPGFVILAIRIAILWVALGFATRRYTCMCSDLTNRNLRIILHGHVCEHRGGKNPQLNILKLRRRDLRSGRDRSRKSSRDIQKSTPDLGGDGNCKPPSSCFIDKPLVRSSRSQSDNHQWFPISLIWTLQMFDPTPYLSKHSLPYVDPHVQSASIWK